MNISELGIIVNHVCELIGLDPDSVGLQSVTKSAQSYISANRIKNLTDFFNGGTDHTSALVKKLLVPETWFFRDNEPFRYLKTVVKERKSTGLFRILSAPCATGEEPYSIALTLIESENPVYFRIDAVDISEEFIETARAGIYTPNSFRSDLNPEHSKYFISDDNKTSRIHPQISAHINFIVMNLLDDGVESRLSSYDAIFCRNLLIYLTRPAREKLLSKLKKLLRPDGILFTGHAEIAWFAQNGFVPVANKKAFACRPAGSDGNSQNLKSTAELVRKSLISRGTGTSPARQTLSVKPAASAQYRRSVVEIDQSVVKTETPPAVTETVKKAAVKVNSLHVIYELADQGNLREAESECKRFLAEHEFSIDGLSLMGKIKHALNDESSALNYFSKAIYLNPNHYDSLVYMSLIYEKLGDKTKSVIFRTRADKAREIR